MTGPRPKSKMTRVPTPPGRRTADRPTACRERTTCSAGARAGADGGSYPRTLRAGPRRRAPPCAPTGRARRPSGCAPARPGRMPSRCARTRWRQPIERHNSVRRCAAGRSPGPGNRPCASTTCGTVQPACSWRRGAAPGGLEAPGPQRHPDHRRRVQAPGCGPAAGDGGADRGRLLGRVGTVSSAL